MGFNPVWANELYIGTEYTPGSGSDAGTWTYAKLCKGIESMEFNANEQDQSYQFLCGQGFAHHETTGAAPQISCSGRRIAGDAAQDYIAPLAVSRWTSTTSAARCTSTASPR